MADEAPDVSQPIDPKVLENLMAGIGTGSVQGPGPSLQQQASTNQAITSAATPAPNMAAGSDNSQMPQQLAQIIQSIPSGGQQAATQQQTQQAEGNRIASSGVPTPRPIALDLINALTGKNIGRPNPNIPGYQGPSKLQNFESFLGNFLTALSSGFANEGHGPGAAMRGAGAAMQAPYQQALQQYQIGQQAQAQQANIDIERLKAQSMVPSIAITGPNGESMMISSQQLPQYLVAGYRLKGQEAQASARTTAATTAANAKESTQDAVNRTLNEARDLFNKGDMKGFHDKTQEANEMAVAKKPPVPKQNESEWIARYVSNPNDKQAKDSLDLLQQRRMDLMKQRGLSMGIGRLYSLQAVVDPEDGTTKLMTGFQVLDEQKSGHKLIPMGRMPQDKMIGMQQLTSEAAPAIDKVRGSLKAFDNPNDRAIFARVMKEAGPVKGDIHSWFGNVLDQAAKEGLSNDGKNLAINLGRLNETLGRLRGVLGLQATDAAMALTLRLAPGPTTPDSKYAGQQIDALDSMIGKAVQIPAFGGGPKKTNKSPNTPTPPSTPAAGPHSDIGFIPSSK